MQRFLSLSARQKIIFLSLLIVMSSVLVYLSTFLVISFPGKIKQIKSLHDEQKFWYSKSVQVDEDLAKFAASNAYQTKCDVQQIAADMEKAISELGFDYTLTETAKGHVGNMTIHRFRVAFDSISFPKLVEFFNKVEAIGNNVAISEAQIKTRSNSLLNAYCVVSILDTE
jgi:type II secretory pathway component PulM